MPDPDVDISDLQAAYEAWPGSRAEKGAVAALILRVRIERAATQLPASVIAKPGLTLIERRLYLSVGEPGLSTDSQARRMQAVAGALRAYAAICELLHGRSPEPIPSTADLDAWAFAVGALEEELSSEKPGDRVLAGRATGDGVTT